MQISTFIIALVASTSSIVLPGVGATIHENENENTHLRGSEHDSGNESTQGTTQGTTQVTRKLVDYCADPALNFCKVNSVCVINEKAERGYECLCKNEDGWEGDGMNFPCQDYNECEGNYPCVAPEDGGFCVDRNPDMMPPKYNCGCEVGFKVDATDEFGRATACVRELCSAGTHDCDSNAVCTDVDTGGYDCTCNAGFVGNGNQCSMTPAMGQQRATDMSFRFSKIPFPDNVTPPPEAQLPMTAVNYPIDQDTFDWLRTSRAHSVRVPGVCNECDINLQELINAIGGEPVHPSSDPTSVYWKELEYVVDIQIERHANAAPADIMPLPTLWQNLNIAQVAEAVHDEYPGIHHVALLQSMDSGGPNAIGFKMNNTVIPFTCHTEFIREIVMISDLLTWAIARVGPLNFGIKWTFGRMRPEEAAHMIKEDELITGVPDSLRQKIKNDLPWGANAASFTAYPEGCPPHPSFPAMHSAGSSASLWMAVILDLTPAEWCQIKLTDYAVSFARTVAGVHYVSDNVAGLQLGQEIIARRLPQFLHDTYGSDIGAVETRIEEVRFDWADFLNTDCAKGNVL